MATGALTVQALTGGRFTLGIGPSHEMAITGWFGIPYVSPVRHTREHLEVLRSLMRGEYVKYAGEFFTVDTQLVVSAPEVPVLVAALSPRMLAVTRDLADGMIGLWVRPRTVAAYLVPRLGDGARVVVAGSVAVTADPDRTRAEFAEQFAMAGELPAYRGHARPRRPVRPGGHPRCRRRNRGTAGDSPVRGGRGDRPAGHAVRHAGGAGPRSGRRGAGSLMAVRSGRR
jgi:alkanesulfonate monooxygenase SsuD/methylene tetrahydromethanopterin reductase-like flavin-dependent oxidoreductase (luciferase family)